MPTSVRYKRTAKKKIFFMIVFGHCRKTGTGTAGFGAEKTGTVTGRKKHNRLTPTFHRVLINYFIRQSVGRVNSIQCRCNKLIPFCQKAVSEIEERLNDQREYGKKLHASELSKIIVTQIVDFKAKFVSAAEA